MPPRRRLTPMPLPKRQASKPPGLPPKHNSMLTGKRPTPRPWRKRNGWMPKKNSVGVRGGLSEGRFRLGWSPASSPPTNVQAHQPGLTIREWEPAATGVRLVALGFPGFSRRLWAGQGRLFDRKSPDRIQADYQGRPSRNSDRLFIFLPEWRKMRAC